MPLVGRYGDEIQLAGSVVLPTTAITVLNVGGGNATLYTDNTGATGGAGAPYNPKNTDAEGNLHFYAVPGEYDLQVGGSVYARVIVYVTGAMVGVANGIASLNGAGILAPSQRWAVVAGINVVNPMASPYNAVGDGSADDTTPLTSALTDLHTSGGKLYLPSRAGFKTTATLNVTKPDLVDIIGPASGQATLLPAFNGDCLRILMSSFVAEKSAGTYGGFTIDGTAAGASASGVHISDCLSGLLTDLRVQNFTGGSAKCVWFDNVAHYTERWQWERVNAVNGTIGVLFDVNGSSSNSFGYHNVDKVHTVCNSGQIGLVLRNGALVYNGHFGMTGNFAAGSTVARIDGITGTGVTQLAPRSLDIEVEVTGGGSVNGIMLSEYGGISGHGTVDLSSGTFVCSNDRTSSGHAGAAALTGRIVTPGLIGTAAPGSAIVIGGHGSSSGKFIPITVDGTTYYMDLRT
jgi:hypothetical protein